MKELSIEEKAKRYDEVINEIKNLRDILLKEGAINENGIICDNFDRIFPELKESEDKRIRKELIDFLEYYRLNNVLDSKTISILTDSVAWLEKQGEQPKKNDVCNNCDQQGSCVSPCPMKLVEKQPEQKSANEPKFKIGEWIYHEISGNAFHINRIENHIYISDEGATISFGRQNDWRLWTIQDAKAGDVLATEGFVFIFKKIREDKGVGYFCANENELHEGDDSTFHIANPNSLMGSINNDFTHYTPATKEQRNALMKSMADAGYTFDFESKELKKIEQKPAEWSEEDEELLRDVSDTYFYNDEDYPEETYKLMLKRVLDWMNKRAKFLRPQNWTKEDKERYISCLQKLGTGNPEQPETINSKWFKEHVIPSVHLEAE